MARYRITHIRKPNRSSQHEHITHVANKVTQNWFITREKAIDLINKGDEFYVYGSDGTDSKVGIVKPDDGREPYLRTYADGFWNDNLLALPEC